METKPKKKIYKKWWFWLIVVIVIAGIKGIGGSKDEPTANTSNTTSTNTSAKTEDKKKEEPKKDEFIKAGMYKVGTDIQPGEYVIVNSSSSCYIQVSKDSSGNLSSIICNDNIAKRSYITINEGEYLTVKGGKIYPVGKEPKVEAKDGKLPEGMYKVGVDIEAGEYKVVAEGQGYMEVAKDSSHLLNSIISNDNFEGEKYITVSDGNYIKLNSASLVIK